MLNFKSYALVSTLLTVSAMAYAAHSRVQFYPATIFLTTNKLNIVILGNLAFFLLLLGAQCIKLVFLSQLNRDEIEELVQNSKYAITETCLALTIFREELNMRILVLFTGLLFNKIFHWLGGMRVEYVARTHGLSTMTHVRLFGLLCTLIITDSILTYSLLSHFWISQQASVLILFAFEFTILTVTIISTTIKYFAYLYDLRCEGRWPLKSTCLFYLELVTDVVRLVLYLCFFLLICTYYGLPLHLIRELCVTFYNLKERCIKFIKYRQMTNNMNANFSDATAEDLANMDRTCIICREDMEVGSTKKLSSCNHMFHFHCLRSWLERSTSCPTCRTQIQTNKPNQSSATPAANQPVHLPPLPAHLAAAIQHHQNANPNPSQAISQSPNQPVSQTQPATSPSLSDLRQPGAASPPAQPAMTPFTHLGPMFNFPSPPATSPVANDSKDQSINQSISQSSPVAASAMASPFGAHMSFNHPLRSTFSLQPFGGPVSIAAPSMHDSAILPVLQAQTTLLQSHMDMLEAELKQVRALYERQLALQESLMNDTIAPAPSSSSVPVEPVEQKQ